MASILLLVLCLWAGTAEAQVTTSTGELSGSVMDPQGTVIAGAEVRISDASRGFRVSSLTAGDGRFRFPLLTPNFYTVEAEAPGFAPAVVGDVKILIGETTRLDVTLQLTRAQYEITVTASLSLAGVERTQQADYVSQTRLENLPINRRSYLDFAQLSAGVVETSTIGDAADYRVEVAPTSGLSFGGSNGRGNTFFVDGIENTGTTGEFRPSLPQVAVQEFQINRSTYSAEEGGGYGGAINVISTSGTNQFHGSVFGYLRNRSIEARNFFDSEKSPFTRIQSGVSIGGPLRKDQTYFFAALERLDRHESVFVPILRDRTVLDRITPSQQELVSFFEQSGNSQMASAATIMRQTMVPGNNPRVRTLFTSNSGVFPFSAALSEPVVRLDHGFSNRTKAFLRLNFAVQTEQNTKFGALVGLNRGSREEVVNDGGMLSLTSELGSGWLSVSRAAFSYYKFGLLPNDTVGPAIDIAGYGSFGRYVGYPFVTLERHFQAQQTFYHAAPKHGFQFGVDFNPIRSTHHIPTFYGGQFTFVEAVPLADALNSITGNSHFSGGLSQGLERMGRADLSQELNAPISSLQAFSLGFPGLYAQGFGTPDIAWWTKRLSGFVNENYHAIPNLTFSVGLRIETEMNPNVAAQINTDPRFGFAWSPAAARNSIVRGGYGFYHAPTDAQVVYTASVFKVPLLNLLVVPASGLSFLINPATGRPLNSADIYQTLLAQGILGNRTLELTDLAQFGLNPQFRLPSTWSVDEAYRNPRSEQASLEIERSIGNASVNIAYNFTRTLHLPFALDRNLVRTGTRGDGTPIFAPVDPNFLSDLHIQSGASAFYHAMIIGANKRAGSHWDLNAHYTLSKGIDEIADLNPYYLPSNQSDRRADRSLSYFDRRHRLVVSGVFQPVTERRGDIGGWYRHLLSEWTVAPILVANSFRPFNVLAGVDNVGDGQLTTHRPLGAGRNIGIGPNWFNLDLRLARTFHLAFRDGLRLRWSGEAFNLFNRTNFESVNNIVGNIPLSSLPRPLVGRRDDPTKPLSFTSAGPRRQFQFGLELEF